VQSIGRQLEQPCAALSRVANASLIAHWHSANQPIKEW